MCLRLGQAARARVETEFPFEAFQRKLLGAYRRMMLLGQEKP
jgi:hypothetical protein